MRATQHYQSVAQATLQLQAPLEVYLFVVAVVVALYYKLCCCHATAHARNAAGTIGGADAKTQFNGGLIKRCMLRAAAENSAQQRKTFSFAWRRGTDINVDTDAATAAAAAAETQAEVEAEAEAEADADTDVDADIDTQPSVNCGHGLPWSHWAVPELSYFPASYLSLHPPPLAALSLYLSCSLPVADFRLVPWRC